MRSEETPILPASWLMRRKTPEHWLPLRGAWLRRFVGLGLAVLGFGLWATSFALTEPHEWVVLQSIAGFVIGCYGSVVLFRPKRDH